MYLVLAKLQQHTYNETIQIRMQRKEIMRTQDTQEVIQARKALQRALLNDMADELSLKNDAAIARLLNVRAPVISKWAAGKLAIGAAGIIAIHEVTGWSTTQIKERLKLNVAKRVLK